LRTRRTINTFASVDGLVRAASFSVARINRARVAIIAGAFVRLTVTVVVYGVAFLGRWVEGITVGQSILCAHPVP
jgi:hypothetical protein